MTVSPMPAPALALVERSLQPSASQPWFKFYPANWQGDELLATCSMAARGFLMECVCLMHRAVPYGYLLVNGKALSDSDLAKLVRATGAAEVRRLRTELTSRGVLSITADGVLYSRRMLRAAKQSAEGREYGRRGGNPALTPLTPTLIPPAPSAVKTQNTDYRGQNPLPPAGVMVDEAIDHVAGAFLERYPEVYARCRNGAAYRVSRMKQERDLAYARELAAGWPHADRLEEMLEIFLRRTDIGDKNKPGTPGQFLHMAPDCDRLLKENGR